MALVGETAMSGCDRNFYEFFAGGGMARAGLEPAWKCLFANDFDEKKGAAYAANWGHQELKVADVGTLGVDDLPGHADLAWASFPCQDLSLAGSGAGLSGNRSGTFWPFWKLVKTLSRKNRAPTLVVLENVCGMLSSHEGDDFSAICTALADGGYQFGAVVVDAVHFVPQSRPRLFFVAIDKRHEIDVSLVASHPTAHWHPQNLTRAFLRLPTDIKSKWIWWSLPPPPLRKVIFSDLIESDPIGVPWHTAAETNLMLSMMSPINLRKVEHAKGLRRRIVGGIYRRTRLDTGGNRVQRAEVRFDDVAGCLRTPAGGSSRQSILVVEGNMVRSRLLSTREAARLMGLPDTYRLPEKYNEAYHLIGDGLVVPVVRFLAKNLLEKLSLPKYTKVAA
ncbi:MAG: DNA cytosine methyltransferase [Rudaea sp.]